MNIPVSSQNNYLPSDKEVTIYNPLSAVSTRTGIKNYTNLYSNRNIAPLVIPEFQNYYSILSPQTHKHQSVYGGNINLLEGMHHTFPQRLQSTKSQNYTGNTSYLNSTSYSSDSYAGMVSATPAPAYSHPSSLIPSSLSRVQTIDSGHPIPSQLLSTSSNYVNTSVPMYALPNDSKNTSHNSVVVPERPSYGVAMNNPV
jgi:hypothetical protein